MIQGPRMCHWCSSMHHDNQGAFSTDEIYQQLEECVDGKSLVEC